MLAVVIPANARVFEIKTVGLEGAAYVSDDSAVVIGVMVDKGDCVARASVIAIDTVPERDESPDVMAEA